MFPKCPASPLPAETLSQLAELRGVLDVVYNPERTGICLAAEGLGLPSESGLAMLVAQAHFASELFQNTTLDDAKVEQIERRIRLSQRNIVLIGMPGAGKTSTGRLLARSLSRPFVDLDDAFEMEFGCSAEVFIRNWGEEEFRQRETEVAELYGSKSGLVIACGGGIVTQERNYPLMHQNGTIAFIDRPLYQLTSAGRPISQLKGIERLASERMGLYESWADVRISCTGSAGGDAALLKARLGL
jgi:shikimate dehydrogenase